MTSRNAIVLSVLLSLPFAACGSDKETGPDWPEVAGDYSGTVTVSYPELAVTISCPATTSVTQNDEIVNIAPLVITGQCGYLSVPIGQATITETGDLGTNSYTDDDSVCGGTYNVTASGGFFGKQLRLSVTGVSDTCWNYNITATLTR